MFVTIYDDGTACIAGIREGQDMKILAIRPDDVLVVKSKGFRYEPGNRLGVRYAPVTVWVLRLLEKTEHVGTFKAEALVTYEPGSRDAVRLSGWVERRAQ